jgi:AcrR family transcriptional regulator
VSSGPIWTSPEPGSRRPRFTRELIAAKALEIADAEGFEAVSMRRLAADLGAGTMTLYHYVRTKDDLVELMDDAIMAEVLVPPEELGTDWREAMAQIARRSKAAWMRHPWSFEAFHGVRFGPNGKRHFEQSLQAVAGLDVPEAERFEIITLVDDYVFGYVARWQGPRGGLQGPSEEEVTAMLAFFDEQIATGEYPTLAALMGEGDPRAAWERMRENAQDPERFERGLQHLLAGIALDLERRGAI